jgi:hypothetical protein
VSQVQKLCLIRKRQVFEIENRFFTTRNINPIGDFDDSLIYICANLLCSGKWRILYLVLYIDFDNLTASNNS